MTTPAHPSHPAPPRSVQPRAGRLRLWFSLWVSDWRPGLLIALLIFGLAFITTAAPRAVESMFSQELRYATGETLGDAQRAISARTPYAPQYGQSDHKDMQRFINGTKETAEEPLRSMMGQGEFFSFDQEKRLLPPKDMGILQTRIVYGVDPDIAEKVELVSGRMPEQSDEFYYENYQGFSGSFTGEGDFWDRITEATLRPVEEREKLELLLHESVALSMDWPLGELRDMEDIQVELVGTFTEKDPTSLYWQFAPNATATSYFNDFDGTEYYTALGFIDPLVWPMVHTGSVQTLSWYPLDPSILETSNAHEVLAALNNFLGRSHTYTADFGAPMVMTFQSEAQERLAEVIAKSDNIGALVTMITVGPLAAGMIVLVLANRLMMFRRRPHLALLSARGATLAQLRRIHWIEGASVAMLPALLGLILATALFGPGGVSGIFQGGAFPFSIFDLVVVLGLPAIYGALLAFSVQRFSLSEQREDLVVKKAGPIRRILEIVVVLFAGAGLYLFIGRGFTIVPGLGVDPVLALLPVLLLTALTIVVLRIYPLPLRALQKKFRTSQKLPAFLGSARAMREGSGGLLPLLATILTLSVAVFSMVTLSTIQEAGARKAWLDTGADLQISGAMAVANFEDELTALDFVDELVLIGSSGQVTVRVGSQELRMSAIMTDLERLAKVQETSGWALNLSDASNSQPAVAISTRADITEQDVLVNGVPVQVLDSAAQLPGYRGINYWVLIDMAIASEINVVPVLDRALVSVNENFDYDLAVAEVRAIVGETANLSTPERSLEQMNAQPTVIGLHIALLSAAVLGLLLAIGSLILFSFTIGPSRNRLFPLLTSLGASSRIRRQLLSWEIVPLALTALISSVTAGIGLAYLMVSVLNLSGFTGGVAHPPLTIGVVSLSLVVGVFIAGIYTTIAMNLVAMKTLDLSKVMRA